MRTGSQTRAERRRSNRAASKHAQKFEKLASRFIDRNIPVFPVASDGKIPCSEHGFKDASTDQAQIREWAKKFPDANIGVPTGSVSGYVVIDLDRKNGVDGVKAFESLCRQLKIKLPDTYRVKTPGGGEHIWFRTIYAGDIRNSVSVLGPGIDVRGQGGYVVAEGSSIDGSRYTCIGGSVDDVKKLPKKLRDAIKNAKKRRRGNGAGTYTEGQRNDALYAEAYRLHATGRSFESTLDLIHQLNESSCQPPLDDREVERLVESATSYEIAPRPNDTLETALTDYGNAVRMAISYEGQLIHIPELRKFFWRRTGEHWQYKSGIEIVFAKKSVRELQRDVPKIDDLKTQEAVSKFAIRSQSRRLIEDCVKLVQTEPEIQRSIAQFDNDPWLLAVQNGVVDLRDKSFRPVSDDDYFLKVCPFEYDEDAECPYWAEFLELVQPNWMMRKYLQKLVGLTLVGTAAPEIIIFIYGAAGTGKSTFVNAVMRFLGRDYAVKIPISVLLMRDRDGSPNELLPLLGARMAVASEVPEGRKFNEARLKDLASKDILTTRPLYAEAIQFEPSHTLWIYGNHLARLSGSDSGIKRRMQLLPFKNVIPDESVDILFEKKLEDELPGIFNWALDGCMDWRRDGLQRRPKRVRRATKGYLTEMDLMKQFICERIVKCPGKVEKGGVLYSVYKEWAIDQHEYPVSNTVFGLALKERGFRKTKGNKGAIYHDIQVLRHGDE